MHLSKKIFCTGSVLKTLPAQGIVQGGVSLYYIRTNIKYMSNENPLAQNPNSHSQQEKIPSQKLPEGTDFTDLLEKYTIQESSTEHTPQNTEFAEMEKRLDELNYAVENAAPEEREKAMQELLEWEEKLNTLEDGLGVTREVADVALTMVHNGSLELGSILDELRTESPETLQAIEEGDTEKAKGFLSTLAQTVRGSKLAQTVGLWTILSIGGMAILGHADEAEGANLQTKTQFSKENIQKLHPLSSNTNMGTLLIKVNSNPTIDPSDKLLFLNAITKNGLSKDKTSLKVIDYVTSGNLTDTEIATVLKLATSS